MTLVVDLRALGTFGQIWDVFYQTFTSLWIMATCVIATREVHQLSLGNAIATSIISIIPVASLIAVTVR